LLTSAIYNVNFCYPGFGGPLCQKCPAGYYSNEFSTAACLKCPCDVNLEAKQYKDQSFISSSAHNACDCRNPDIKTVELYEVALILVMFNLIFYVAYAVYLRNTSVKDDRNER
jgi:hypothetical protein